MMCQLDAPCKEVTKQCTSGGSRLENRAFDNGSRWSRDVIRSISVASIGFDIPARAWSSVWQSRTMLPPPATTASSKNETARQSEQLVEGRYAALRLEDTTEWACARKGVRVVTGKASLTAIAACSACGDRLAFMGKVKLFQRVVCPNCGAELEVVETEPVELEWAYEDYDE